VSSDCKATLVVGAVESLSAYVLPWPLAVLRERWPDVVAARELLRRYFEAGEMPAPRTQALGVAVGTTALGLLPVHAIEGELRAGSLVEVELASRLPVPVMRAVGDLASPMVAELIDHLRDPRITRHR
jgi:hypothetical protein